MKPAWQSANDDIQRNQNHYFVSIVEKAAQGRLYSVMTSDIVNKTIEEKTGLILDWSIDFFRMCWGGQVKPEYFHTVFDKFLLELGRNKSKTTVTDEDIKTGFMLFSAIVYYSEPVSLSQFLLSLLTTQSPRTTIKATVNTIQSEEKNIKYKR